MSGLYPITGVRTPKKVTSIETSTLTADHKQEGGSTKPDPSTGEEVNMTNRWVALVIIFASFLQFTLNWFAIIPMFGHLIGEMGVSPLQIGGIVSAFVAGYGIAHIPGGILAERYGMRFALLAGIAVEGIGAVMTASAHGYQILLIARFLCGVGGSIYIGSAVGLTSAWFRERELATANGLITGVAFSVGAAIGLFGWGMLGEAIGWRPALLAGAGVSVVSLLLLVVAYPHPPVEDIGMPVEGHSLASLRRVISSGRLWVMSLAFFGGYGSYFTAVAMLPAFAVETLHLDPEQGHEIGAILLLSGIIGSFLGGWLADRVLGLLRTFLLACVLEAVTLLLIPHVGVVGLQVAAGVVGAATILAFVSWIGLPGLMRARFRASDIPTAVGLMLTIVAVGGVVLPPLYAELSQSFGVSAGWIGLAAITVLCGCVGLFDARQMQREVVSA
ncbi:MAG TPA: MFS transporter [Dongiaceae bacterium]|nr:MFS transporter [Dongiaceae bacterium]